MQPASHYHCHCEAVRPWQSPAGLCEFERSTRRFPQAYALGMTDLLCCHFCFDWSVILRGRRGHAVNVKNLRRICRERPACRSRGFWPKGPKSTIPYSPYRIKKSQACTAERHTGRSLRNQINFSALRPAFSCPRGHTRARRGTSPEAYPAAPGTTRSGGCPFGRNQTECGWMWNIGSVVV